MNRFIKAALLRGAASSLVLCLAAPALADHTGPTGVGSSGGGASGVEKAGSKNWPGFSGSS
jgi:hypothetical protein